MPDKTPPERPTRLIHMNKAWSLSIFTKVAVGVVIAAIAGAAGMAWERWDTRIRHFQYVASSVDGLLSIPDLGQREIAIRVDDILIPNISVVSVSVFNTTDRDYTNVPVVITMEYEEGSDVTLLSRNISSSVRNVKLVTYDIDDELERLGVTGEAVYRDDLNHTDSDSKTKFFDTLDDLKKYMSENRHLFFSRGYRFEYEYEVSVANRSDDAIFSVDYVYAGADAPNVDVAVRKMGLAAEPRSSIPRRKSFTQDYLIVILIGGGAFLFCSTFVYILKRRGSVTDDCSSGNTSTEVSSESNHMP